MPFREIKNVVYAVGAIDWDRRLFDELIPLPDGTTYNSYLIKTTAKTALIDTVDPVKEDVLFSNLSTLGIKKLDYVVVNHTEQDHSGTIPKILKKFPEATLVTNPKCKSFCIDHLLIPEDKFQEIKDGDTLSLGEKTLEFIIAPWVHWPETMLTYLKEDRILFTLEGSDDISYTLLISCMDSTPLGIHCIEQGNRTTDKPFTYNEIGFLTITVKGRCTIQIDLK